MKRNIIVIGGGASGLTAAIAAKEAAPEIDVTILEHCDRAGKKILATGNGRCNLSNRDISPEKYHGSLDAVRLIGRTESGEEMFGRLGVLTFADSQGRVYPRSESAATILNVLRMRCGELGIDLKCGREYSVKAIRPEESGVSVICDAGGSRCGGLIIAAGGYASPQHGTDGGMVKILRELGLKTAKVCPAVAPLRTEQALLKGLKGVRIKGRVSAYSGEQHLRTEEGEIQFTDSALSGICVFNLAYLFAEYEGRLTLKADLLPELTAAELEEYLRKIRISRGKQPLEELLTGIFAKNPAIYLVKRAIGRPMTELISTVSDHEIKALAELVKCAVFPVTGCAGWKDSQATCGGIHGSCVDDDLRVKRFSSVYLCGEVLDVVGDCGGYNLQWAWSSGLIAGRSCAERLKGGGR